MNELIFRAFNAFVFRSGAIDSVISFAAERLPLLAFLALLFWAAMEIWKADTSVTRGKMWKQWAFVFTASFIAWVFAEIIKGWMQSPRPFLVLDDAKLLFPHGDYDSFPSAHAAIFSALATAASLFKLKLARLLWVIVAVIGIARVAAGIHWPSDIAGGVALGSIVAYALFRARRHFA